ncbi:L,D-transpeptidase [Tepidibacter sp. Z1-5]|uniref:L,D-transpeptidase n=1 Tax=Tepidibacter sp. Z1-5 TaxID=3134138 RepID=UPI0030BDE3D5
MENVLIKPYYAFTQRINKVSFTIPLLSHSYFINKRYLNQIYNLNLLHNLCKNILIKFFNSILFYVGIKSLGKPSTPTPKGTFTIVNKAYKPGGPFGERWLGLSKPHYGIHGTNNPSSIGKAISNGCIRMYNKDVIELYNIVRIGTVVIIN